MASDNELSEDDLQMYIGKDTYDALVSSTEPRKNCKDRLIQTSLPCVLCHEVFEFEDGLETHLYESHKLVVHQFLKVADLTEYVAGLWPPLTIKVP